MGIALGRFLYRVGGVLVPLWDNVGFYVTVWRSFWYRFATVLIPFWNRVGINLGSSWNRVDAYFVDFCDLFFPLTPSPSPPGQN